MTLLQLRYFVAVVDARGISAAAKKLGVAQPTVSDNVAALESVERGVGRMLIRRVIPPRRADRGKSCELTAAGAALLPHAREILRLVSVAENELLGVASPAQ